MKPETIKSDIRLTLAARQAEAEARTARARVLPTLDACGDAPRAMETAIAARNASHAAASDLKKIPAPRRTLARSLVEAAEEIAKWGTRMGAQYSGTTSRVLEWGDAAKAETRTASGDQYSKGCTYKKTDAAHVVTLDPAGVALLVESEPLRRRSMADGLPLIALYPDDSAVWVRSKGKAIVSERGWVVGNAAVCYHSIKSREHARKGFESKHAAHLKELQERRLTAKQERRARLVARLCHGLTATLADAKALGYCAPGIAQFQEKHGIGNAATLPQLIRTGDPSAVRLALKLARNVKPVEA
jgi:hypothetical protein